MIFDDLGCLTIDMPTQVGIVADMTTTQKTHILFTDLNGRVCCPDHMGAYANEILAARPRARVIETDITVWERMTSIEISEWAEFLNTEYGQTELCETCKSEAKRQLA